MYSFGDVLGNEHIKRSMVASVLHGRVSHAYIICGGAGFGKKLLAHAFAKVILCGDADGGQACGVCKSCKTYDSGNNPDISVVSSEKQSLGVTEVREDILEGVAVLPFASSKRVYIIPNAHTMTPAAQNAMLLTLEDGPKHAVFLLLADGMGAFLPTLLSRCIVYKIPPLDGKIIYEYLIGQNVPHEKAQMAAQFCGGGIGRAMTLANDEDFAQLRDMVLGIANNIEIMDIPAIFAAAKAIEGHKDQIGDILDIFQSHYRDALIAQSNRGVLPKIRAIWDAKEKLKRNCNFLLTIEVMLLKCSAR
ncbi:MAG: DNA polymerase III subunit [Defluviitaleaceae bacterium]|nr:DNA polymerase III subunit [Defluviitaleaceae bacterium]